MKCKNLLLRKKERNQSYKIGIVYVNQEYNVIA